MGTESQEQANCRGIGARCGLVERAGQGFDLIYRECIRIGKPLPDFWHTSEHSVWVTLHGEIQDPEFLRFLEEIGQERLSSFSTEDFLIVDLIHREQPVPRNLATRTQYLMGEGIIERLGGVAVPATCCLEGSIVSWVRGASTLG